MRIYIFGISIAIATSVAFGQAPKITLPTTFMAPPPSAQPTIQNMGSLQFEAFRSNLLRPQIDMIPKNEGASTQNPALSPNFISLASPEQTPHHDLLPKPFKSRIQGLQFIQLGSLP